MDGTTIALIGGIFTGFFALIKYVVGQQQKANDTFMTYIKEKNGHNERIATDFSKRIEESQNVLRDLTAEIARFRPHKGRR